MFVIFEVEFDEMILIEVFIYVYFTSNIGLSDLKMNKIQYCVNVVIVHVYQ